MHLLARLPGFRSFQFVKITNDHAIVILEWETEADAVNGSRSFRQTFFPKNIAPFLSSDQQRSVGEVLVEHKK